MSRIRGTDTVPEKRVRSALHRLGFRFSLRRRDLPGKPDIVLPRHMTAIFVHGCFWHRHTGCRNSVHPKTRVDFWQKKLDGNVARDKKKAAALKQLGWRVVTVWECETDDDQSLSQRLRMRLKQGTS